MNTRKRARKQTASESMDTIASSDNLVEKMKKTDRVSSDSNVSDVNATHSDINVPATNANEISPLASVNSTFNFAADEDTEPMFPDDQLNIDEVLAQADRILAEINQASQPSQTTQAEPDALTVTVNEVQNASTTVKSETNQTNNPTAQNNDEPSTSANQSAAFDDSVIVIEDSSNPLPRPAMRYDEDVIFVHEIPARQRITATIDLCATDDDDHLKQPTTQKMESAALPPMLNSPPSATGVAVKCPVCLESVPNDEVHSTICGHLYCGPCIKNTIKTRKKCPMCNKTLNAKQIHRIYFHS